jgi:hypothetical protein
MPPCHHQVLPFVITGLDPVIQPKIKAAKIAAFFVSITGSAKRAAETLNLIYG